MLAETIQLIQSDTWRMECLEAVDALGLPDWYIVAGFLRNAIWDTLHAKPARTPLNDVDVIYSDLGDHGAAAEAQIESVLRARCPTVTWEALGIKPGCIFATGMLPIGIRRTPLRTGSKRRPASAFESGAIEGSRSWRPTGSRRTGR